MMKRSELEITTGKFSLCCLRGSAINYVSETDFSTEKERKEGIVVSRGSEEMWKWKAVLK